jgi:hypothetical protein
VLCTGADRTMIETRTSSKSAAASLYSTACKHHLEGIVAKHKSEPYIFDDSDTTWFNIRNRTYTQIVGREERLERPHEPERASWAWCAVACAGLSSNLQSLPRLLIIRRRYNEPHALLPSFSSVAVRGALL